MYWTNLQSTPLNLKNKLQLIFCGFLKKTDPNGKGIIMSFMSKMNSSLKLCNIWLIRNIKWYLKAKIKLCF